MSKNTPILLILARLLFAIVIFFSIVTIPAPNQLVLTLMYAGIISDIFDGIIARKLNISTQNLRVLDTVVDLFFYIALLVYIVSGNPSIWMDHRLAILLILSFEVLMYVISLVRFGKLPSPHAILSKFWGIYLVVEFTLLLLNVDGIHFGIALLFGTVAHVDRALIYALLREWDHDVPSAYHAFQLRAGKPIKRSKLFNG